MYILSRSWMSVGWSLWVRCTYFRKTIYILHCHSVLYGDSAKPGKIWATSTLHYLIFGIAGIVALSIVPDINISACGTVDLVTNSWWEFDRVIYKHHWEFPIGKQITPIFWHSLFYAGTAGDMETSGRLNIGGPHKGQRFSAKDRDWDDNDSDNCAGTLTF